MHILIISKDKKQYIVKKSDIRRVYETGDNRCVVCFTGNKNSPITVQETPEDFFNIYLSKEQK